MHTTDPPLSARRWSRRRAAGLILALVLFGGLARPAIADGIDEYNLALQFYKQDRWELAASKFQDFLKQVPATHEKVPLAKLYLGQAYVHQRKFKEARPLFRDFVANYPKQADIELAMYRAAECSYFLDDFPAAKKELDRFVAAVPAEHSLGEWALQYLGETELQLKNHQGAATAFEKGLKRFEKGRLAEEMTFGLARAYEGLGRDADAAVLYDQLAKSPGGRAADAQFNLAAKLFENKKYDDAAKRFAFIAEKFSTSKVVPLATLNAGYSRYHLGQFPEAIGYFRKVADNKAADNKELALTANYWIGLSLKSQKKFSEAAQLLLDQLQQDNDQPLAEQLLFHAADSKLGAKDYPEAQRLFQEVTRRWPAGQLADDALHLATEAAMLAGNFEAAQQFQQQFQQRFPQSGLKLPQQLIWGRLLLAEGDKLSTEAGSPTDAAKQRYRDSAEAFKRVLQQSKIVQTQSLARLQLARAWDRLDSHSQVIEILKPLVDAARQQKATDEALTALAMQSTALLSLERYDESIKTANDFLSRRPGGTEAAEAYANLSLANAHKKQWQPASLAIGKLRQAGTRSLADRVAYEVAEVAYDAKQWETAETLFDELVKRGAEGEFYRPSISGLAYSLHEQARVLDKQAEEAGAGNGTTQLATSVRKFDEASQWFTRLAELSAKADDRVVESDAIYMKGLSLRLARRLADAAAVFSDAIDRFSLPADATNPKEDALKTAFNAYRSAREAARVYQELQQTTLADQSFESAYSQLKRQPADRQEKRDVLVNEWALLHYNAGDFDRANELFAKLIEETPESPWADDARMLRAEHDYFDKKYAEARKVFRALVAEDKTDDFVRERSLVLLMDIAGRLDDWQDVTVVAGQLKKRFPNSPHQWEAEYRRGEAALQLDKTADAQQILTKLTEQQTNDQLKQQPWYPSVWLKLAESQLRLKQYEALTKTAEEFSRLFPDSPLRYYFDDLKGQASYNLARFDEARASFKNVIDSPEGKGTETAAKAQLFIAEAYFVQDEYEKAFENYYRVLLYGFPELQAGALFQAGKCEELLKRWKGAAKSYQQLLEDHPDSDYADGSKARLADIKQRFPQAVEP